MKFSEVLLWWLVLCFNLSIANSFWGSPYSRGVKPDGDSGTEPPRKEHKEHYDENQLMLQLARLYVSSPERIILLLTMDPIAETCQDITDVLNRINTTMADCIPLPRDNLYMKLRDGVELFYSNICGPKKQPKHINNYHECVEMLRDDLIDCEGPADWFEGTEKSCVCPIFTDILDCNYVRTGMLCGLKPARMLRKLSAEIIKKVLLVNCPVPRSLPRVKDPLPSDASALTTDCFSIYCCIFILVFLLHFTQ